MTYTYKFNDGSVYTSKLKRDEFLERLDRLDWLRVMTEGYEGGEGENMLEKDFLSYMYEDLYISAKDIEVLDFYTGGNANDT